MPQDFREGVIANVFTCFNEDETLDDVGQRAFLDALLDRGGVDAFFVRSGMGQMYTYSFEDAKQIAKVACTHMAGKAPVLVGCSGEWDRNFDRKPDGEVFTQQAVELSKHAEGLGAAAVVHTMPEAIPVKEGETPLDVTLRYLEAVTGAVDIPVVLYQPPGTDPAFRVTADTIQQMAQVPGVSAIKISTADAGYVADICWAAKKLNNGFRYISGAETAYYAALYLGSCGVIGQGACLNPSILQAVKERFDAGDHDGAMEAQRSINLLVEKCGGAVHFFKKYLAEKGYAIKPIDRGIRDNPYMKSFPQMDDEQYEAYKKIFEAELARYGS